MVKYNTQFHVLVKLKILNLGGSSRAGRILSEYTSDLIDKAIYRIDRDQMIPMTSWDAV